jgi:hypothetical protein
MRTFLFWKYLRESVLGTWAPMLVLFKNIFEFQKIDIKYRPTYKHSKDTVWILEKKMKNVLYFELYKKTSFW